MNDWPTVAGLEFFAAVGLFGISRKNSLNNDHDHEILVAA
jgi:hypothetical protein